MNLYTHFRNRWAATTALNTLLPSTSVHTGIPENPTLPYATWATIDDSVAGRSSKRRFVDETLQLDIYAEKAETVRAIRDLVESTFDESYRPTLDFGTCDGWRYASGNRGVRQEGGLWKATIVFTMSRNNGR